MVVVMVVMIMIRVVVIRVDNDKSNIYTCGFKGYPVDITKGITNKSVGISNRLHNLLSSNPSIVHVDKP